MLRPMRRTHLLVWSVLAAVLPLLIGFAVRARN
jgi:hypothetical protein